MKIIDTVITSPKMAYMYIPRTVRRREYYCVIPDNVDYDAPVTASIILVPGSLMILATTRVYLGNDNLAKLVSTYSQNARVPNQRKLIKLCSSEQKLLEYVSRQGKALTMAGYQFMMPADESYFKKRTELYGIELEFTHFAGLTASITNSGYVRYDTHTDFTDTTGIIVANRRYPITTA